MAFPGWLTALGATIGGYQQAQQQKQQQQQRQQMIQALLAQRTQQSPGGLGSQPSGQMFGPSNWGAQNTSQGGVISDQWGNPIGPAAGSAASPVSAASPAAMPPAPVPTPAPNPLPTAQGAVPGSTPQPSAFADPTGAGASAIPYMNGPYQAGTMDAFGAPTDAMSALFSGFAGV